jgi:hypothetical protein
MIIPKAIDCVFFFSPTSIFFFNSLLFISREYTNKSIDKLLRIFLHNNYETMKFPKEREGESERCIWRFFGIEGQNRMCNLLID